LTAMWRCTTKIWNRLMEMKKSCIGKKWKSKRKTQSPQRKCQALRRLKQKMRGQEVVSIQIRKFWVRSSNYWLTEWKPKGTLTMSWRRTFCYQRKLILFVLTLKTCWRRNLSIWTPIIRKCFYNTYSRKRWFSLRRVSQPMLYSKRSEK
jgi:hypothetical protein